MAGTNNSWNNQIAGSYNQIILNAGTNGVAISTDASAATVNVATGGAIKTATFGSTTASSTTTIQGPSAGVFAIGVQGVAVSNKNYVTINTSTGALGSDAGPASGITTINGNTGSVTGTTVTLQGTVEQAGTLKFSGSGTVMTLNAADANFNVILGGTINPGTLPSGTGNVAMGIAPFVQGSLLTGNFNVGMGYTPFSSLTSGAHNAGFGQQALIFLTTGSYNMSASAYQGGNNYTSSESSNISINASVTTVTGESNVCRIGDGTGTGVQQLNKTYISGIFGKTVGVVTGVPVVIDNADQLGTVVSSGRYKENIALMDDHSEAIYGLRPVTFNYKSDQSKTMTVGLIAEEVQEVMPSLCVLDEEGQPMTVKYLDLIPMLLNEVQKLRQELDELREGL